MQFLLTILWITALAGIGGTGVGGLLSCLFRRDSSKTVSLLLSFAAGVMTSVVCLDLLTTALSPEGGGSVSPYTVALGVMVGYAVVYVLNAWIDRNTDREIAHIDKRHPKTADSLEELIHANHLKVHERNPSDTKGLFVAGLVMAAAIALHNMPEGMVIGASFAENAAEQLLSRSGLLMALVIGMHNVPEGMAVAVPLISGGMKKWKAVLLTASTGLPTVIGAWLGYYLGTTGPLALALSLSFASGAMLYVVFGELLPESILMWRSKLPALATVLGMMTGLLIIYL